jgi:hypothetical protein
MLPAADWVVVAAIGALVAGWQLVILGRRPPAKPVTVRHGRPLPSVRERWGSWQAFRWGVLGLLGGCLGLAARWNDLALAWPLLGGIVLMYALQGLALLRKRHRA